MATSPALPRIPGVIWGEPFPAWSLQCPLLAGGEPLLFSLLTEVLGDEGQVKTASCEHRKVCISCEVKRGS